MTKLVNNRKVAVRICAEHGIKTISGDEAQKCDYCIYSEYEKYLGDRLENNKALKHDLYLSPNDYIKYSEIIKTIDHV